MVRLLLLRNTKGGFGVIAPGTFETFVGKSGNPFLTSFFFTYLIVLYRAQRLLSAY